MRRGGVLFLAALTAAGCLAGRQVVPRLTVWATGESRKIFPNDPPESSNHHWDGLEHTVRLRAARNETVAFQLILSCPDKLDGVEIAFSPLTHERLPALIGAEDIIPYRQWYVPVEKATDRAGSTGPGEYPDPLIPFRDPYSPEKPDIASPLTLEPGRNLPVWVDIRVAPGTPAGKYRGEAAISAAGNPLLRLKIDLVVWPFSLPSTPPLKVFFDLYGWRWARGEKLPWSLCSETWEVLSRYEVMAHRHGFSNGHWGLMPGGAEQATQGVDWSAYDRFLGTVIDGSLFEDGEPPACWELPFPENWDPGDEVLAAYCRQVVEHWDQKGWDLERAFAYVWDEKGPDHPRVKSYGEVLRKASRDRINYFYTCPPSPPLFGVVDWWAPRASSYEPAEMRARQALGDKAFFYHAGEPAVGLMCLDADGLAWRTWAWMAWIYGSDGFFDWSANFWSEDPYRDPMGFDDDNGNMYLFYPGRGLENLGLPALAGPVPSFRLKALRRGIQDYGYFALAREAGLNIESTLRLVVRRGLGVTGAYGIDRRAWSRDPEAWYQARDKVGEILSETVAQGAGI